MKKAIFVLALSMSFVQCSTEDYSPIDSETDSGIGTDTGSGNQTNPSGTVTYLGNVKPILDQLCVSCHGSVSPKDGLNISTYTLAKNKIDKIIKSMDGSSDDDIMPPSGKVSNDLIQTLRDWKSDGLLEGTTSASGDGTGSGTGGGGTGGGTTTVSYVSTIEPILRQQCTACHGASNPSGNLSLTTYLQAKNSIDITITRIDLQNGQAGVMPTAGRMSAANIQAFKDWKAQGLLEN